MTFLYYQAQTAQNGRTFYIGSLEIAPKTAIFGSQKAKIKPIFPKIEPKPGSGCRILVIQNAENRRLISLLKGDCFDKWASKSLQISTVILNFLAISINIYICHNIRLYRYTWKTFFIYYLFIYLYICMVMLVLDIYILTKVAKKFKTTVFIFNDLEAWLPKQTRFSSEIQSLFFGFLGWFLGFWGLDLIFLVVFGGG